MAKRDSVYNHYYAPHLNGGKMVEGNNDSENRLNLHLMMYRRMFTELVLHRFEWTNLPESVDVRFLEMTLAHQGSVVFYQHPVHDRFLVSRSANAGYINHYDNPTSFTVIANRLESITLGPRECVPIWNNYLRTPEWDIIEVFSYKLASVDIDIELVADNLRMTNIVAVPDGQRLTWQNIVRQRKAGEPVIMAHNSIDTSQFVSLDVGGDPDSLDKLLIAKTKLMNDAMTMLGIDNANVDKKERLVTEEVTANHEQVDAMLNIALKSRKEAVEQINDMFSLDISVDPATGGDADGMLPGYDGADLLNGAEEEGEDHGDIHDDDSRTNER